MWTEKRRSSKEQLEAIFDLHHLLRRNRRQDRFKTIPYPEGLVLSLGAAQGWIVLGKIEPWIINTLRYWVTVVKELAYVMQVKESDI